MNMIKTFLEIDVGDSGTPIAANEKFSAAIFTAGKWLDGQKTVLLK